MARLNIENVKSHLRSENFSEDQIQTIVKVIRDNLPPEILSKALIFLGIVTVVLAAGFILLIARGETVPGEGWTALAAGIGGLAGIFTAK